jgi:prepilin-type N-terminal cleavage/methylation domain-containing protein
MLQKLNKRKADAKGFTIIEVLIVLAIVGLIMLIVFLAVPALQRNNRNTQRRNDVSHLGGLINEYITNNQGSLPTLIATGTGTTTTTLYLNNDKFSIMTVTGSPTATIPGTLPTALDQTYVYTTATCNGNTPQAGTSSRSAVIFYNVEGTGGTVGQCSQI